MTVGSLLEHDVIIIGTGIVGAACAFELALAGRRVLVLDRGPLTGGTTAAGAGQVVASDIAPGPKLELARTSMARWRDYAAELSNPFAYTADGSVVVARDAHDRAVLADLVSRHRDAGVTAELVEASELRALEPDLAHDLELGALYPDDAQVQPVLAAAALLTEARMLGAEIREDHHVIGFEHDRTGRVSAVRTTSGTFGTGAVVNAAGPWSTALARLAGSDLPVRPRRGHLLMTGPTAPLLHHRVSEAGPADLPVGDLDTARISTVVAPTPAGRILLGASDEPVGFDPSIDLAVVRSLAARARRLLPGLAGVELVQVTIGARAWGPDHLPIIGEDPDVRGLWHATGHAGAGVGLAPATAQLIRAGITDTPGPVDPLPFRVGRPSLMARSSAARPIGAVHA